MPRGLKGLAVVLGTGLVIALSGCAEPRQAEQPAARTTEPARAESTATDHPGQHAAPAAAPADPRQSQPANAAQPGSAEAPAAASAGTQPEPAAVGKEAEDQAKKEAKEARDRVRKLSKLQRDLEVARLRLSKLKLDQDHAEIKFDESLAKAKADLELARKKLADFKQISVPERTERAKLNLAMAEDGLREAQEELAQLELMYSEEQFADKTKEIVVGRARRRLERSQRNVELQRDEFKTLVETTIPTETIEQDLALEDREHALTYMQRDEASAKLERQIALINAEEEITRLENEQADVQEEMQDAQKKKAEAAQKAPPSPAGENK